MASKKKEKKSREVIEHRRAPGRPPGYRKAIHDKLVKHMAMAGLTDAEMAVEIGISRSTLNRWKVRHKTFKAAFTDWKKIADERVERSLFERAVGYSHPEEVIKVLKDGTVIKVETEKHYPPDTGAAFIWLKNRLSKIWRDRAEFKITGDLGEELDKARKRANGDQ